VDERVATFLDRVNISQARLDGLEKDLGLKGNQFQIALLVFFVSAPLRCFRCFKAMFDGISVTT
jgi:hypothetical protein